MRPLRYGSPAPSDPLGGRYGSREPLPCNVTAADEADPARMHPPERATIRTPIQRLEAFEYFPGAGETGGRGQAGKDERGQGPNQGRDAIEEPNKLDTAINSISKSPRGRERTCAGTLSKSPNCAALTSTVISTPLVSLRIWCFTHLELRIWCSTHCQEGADQSV
jgi:hypothetical protein